MKGSNPRAAAVVLSNSRFMATPLCCASPSTCYTSLRLTCQMGSQHPPPRIGVRLWRATMSQALPEAPGSLFENLTLCEISLWWAFPGILVGAPPTPRSRLGSSSTPVPFYRHWERIREEWSPFPTDVTNVNSILLLTPISCGFHDATQSHISHIHAADQGFPCPTTIPEAESTPHGTSLTVPWKRLQLKQAV